MRKGKMWSSPS